MKNEKIALWDNEENEKVENIENENTEKEALYEKRKELFKQCEEMDSQVWKEKTKDKVISYMIIKWNWPLVKAEKAVNVMDDDLIDRLYSMFEYVEYKKDEEFNSVREETKLKTIIKVSGLSHYLKENLYEDCTGCEDKRNVSW